MSDNPMTAETYTPSSRIGWWGGPDMRIRCLQDDKVVFPDQAAAEQSAAKIRARGNTAREDERMCAYRGKCGHWHVGHSRRAR